MGPPHFPSSISLCGTAALGCAPAFKKETRTPEYWGIETASPVSHNFNERFDGEAVTAEVVMQPRSWKSCLSFCVAMALFAFLATMFFAPESLSNNVGPASAETELLSGAGDGDVHAVAEALRAGANINATSPIGSTPLMIACSAGNHDVVRYLLDQGAPINAKGGHGFTALYFAVSKDDTSLVQLLLDRGADPNVVWRERMTPVKTAEELQFEDIAKLLREHGAHRARHCGSMAVVIR